MPILCNDATWEGPYDHHGCPVRRTETADEVGGTGHGAAVKRGTPTLMTTASVASPRAAPAMAVYGS